jgi:hypothetical protein
MPSFAAARVLLGAGKRLGGSSCGNVPSIGRVTSPRSNSDWERPDRDEWVGEILRDGLAGHRAGRVLVARNLRGHAVAPWADQHDAQVRAALLVAPPGIGYSASCGAQIDGFCPPAGNPLPFRAVRSRVFATPGAL